MTTRKLGQNGTEIFPLGYGAMSLSDFYGPIDATEAEAVLTKAIDLGIDHLDTSNIYGMGVSEDRIGAFLKKQGKQAQNFFKIATKGGIIPGTGFINTREHLTEALDASLKRLGVECVELYYVHRREAVRPIEEVTEILADFVKAGKVRQIGYSEISPNSLMDAHAVHPVAAVQSEYSLSTRYPELGLVQRTKELGATMVAFSPVGRSLLTDSPHDRAKAEKIGFLENNPRFMEPNLSRNHAAAAGFRSLAADMGVSAATLAIAWLIAKDDHIVPIPGTRSPERLAEMAAGVHLKLSDSDIAAIERALPLGWAHGDRYSVAQWNGPEKYC